MLAQIDRAIGGLAFALAILAGVVLVIVTVLTCVSITGRAFVFAGLGPVPGDVELVQMAIAFAVTGCLPWCQWKRGHVTVDIFLGRFGRRFNAFVDVIANLMMTAVAVVIAWRVGAGMVSKMDSSFALETTFILGLPVWWGYAGVLACACIFALVCFWTVIRSIREVAGGEAIAP